MKNEQLFEAIGHIDSQYIEESQPPTPKKLFRKILWSVITGIIAIALILLFTLPLMGKDYNPYYYISVEDGKYYIVSRDDPKYGDLGLGSWHGVYFDSIQEIHDDFVNCNFTEEELKHIQAMLEIIPGKVAIPDINHLCQPILPDNIQWTGGAVWSGTEMYSFRTSQDTHKSFAFSVLSKEDYELRKDTLTNYTGTDILELVRVEKITDRNATVYYTKSKRNGNESSFLFYMIEVNGRKIFVEEHQNIGNDPLSNSLRMYICENGFYGVISIHYDNERPSVEYLSSFGLTPIE